MTYYIYDGVDLVQEGNAVGFVVASYVFARHDHPLTMTRGGLPTITRPAGQRGGSDRWGGALVVGYRYDPWGNAIAMGAANRFGQSFRFTGR